MPNITIPLGISLKSKASIKNLRKRARSRAEIVASGQPDLAFLTNSDFSEESPLLVVDGKYEIEGPIPKQVQVPLFPNEGYDGVTRQDAAEELAVQQVLAAVTVSSQLLDEVAIKLATSSAVKHDIGALEKKIGLDTGPARSFIYKKQESFDVSVDGEPVTFNSHIVRTVAPKGDPVLVLFTPGRPKSEGMTVKGRVDATRGDNRKAGVQSGGTHDFRFGLLEPWQAALIDAAIHFQKQILVTADEADSTCSLNSVPNSIVEVHNWPDLLEMALTELSKAARLINGAERTPAVQTDVQSLGS
jgi:hypothetical protein